MKSLDRYVTRIDGVTQFKKGDYITLIPNKDGYLQCKLCKDGKSRTVKIHRVVAENFIPNADLDTEVNHIDCNRQNNCVDNLEWVSHKDNVLHSTKIGHYKKPVGEKNWNYGNTTLKNYYAIHPEEKQKLSRKSSKNGRSRKVGVIINNKELHFDYIGECAKYILENNIVKDISNESLNTRILERLRTKKPYQGLTFFEI